MLDIKGMPGRLSSYVNPMISLAQLIKLALGSSAVSRKCGCAASPVGGWERVLPTFPEAQLRPVGTLIADPYAEASYREWHPSGTDYWSEDAPIAVFFYPYNRCTVAQCIECGRVYLRYAEVGGYYLEHRIRALDPALISDAKCLA